MRHGLHGFARIKIRREVGNYFIEANRVNKENRFQGQGFRFQGGKVPRPIGGTVFADGHHTSPKLSTCMNNKVTKGTKVASRHGQLWRVMGDGFWFLGRSMWGVFPIHDNSRSFADKILFVYGSRLARTLAPPAVIPISNFQMPIVAGRHGQFSIGVAAFT